MRLEERSPKFRKALHGKTGDLEDTYEVIRLDGSSHAVKTIEYEHAEIHSGSSYGYTGYKDQTVNHVWDIQITTADNDKVPHLVFEFNVETETLWHFYENVNIILGGTGITPVNRDRGSSNTSLVTVAYITNTSLGNANADTAVAGATTLSEGITGVGKKEGGEGGARHEWLLKKNEDYCLRFIASSAGYVNYHLDWYEHRPKT